MAANLLSVSDLMQLAPGSFVEPGFTAVVRRLEPANGKKPPKAILADATGSATILATLWSRPKMSIGEQFEFTGKGMKISEYNGTNEVSVGDKTAVVSVGMSVHNAEQVDRAAAGAPSVSGQAAYPPNGHAVGSAIKEAQEHMRFIYTPAEARELMKRPGMYWDSVYEFASDQLRIARLLENGKLKPSIREREGRTASSAASTTPQQTTQPPRRTQPENERQAANLSDEPGEDVPW